MRDFEFSNAATLTDSDRFELSEMLRIVSPILNDWAQKRLNVPASRLGDWWSLAGEFIAEEITDGDWCRVLRSELLNLAYSLEADRPAGKSHFLRKLSSLAIEARKHLEAGADRRDRFRGEGNSDRLRRKLEAVRARIRGCKYHGIERDKLEAEAEELERRLCGASASEVAATDAVGDALPESVALLLNSCKASTVSPSELASSGALDPDPVGRRQSLLTDPDHWSQCVTDSVLDCVESHRRSELAPLVESIAYCPEWNQTERAAVLGLSRTETRRRLDYLLSCCVLYGLTHYDWSPIWSQVA